MKRRLLIWLPLIIGGLLFAVFYRKLSAPASSVLASKMINMPLPQFVAAPAFFPQTRGMTSTSYSDGKPRLLNVFASWCGPCIVEMPQLLQLQAAGVQIDGLAIHDKPKDIAKFLADYGNPYARIGLDPQSRIQIDLGSAGAPETFIIDGKGMIRYQHIGVIMKQDVPMLLAMLKKLK